MRRGEGTGKEKERRNKNNRHYIAIQYTRQDMTSPSPRNIIRQHDTVDKGPRLQAKPRDDKTEQDKTAEEAKLFKKQNSNLMSTELYLSWT